MTISTRIASAIANAQLFVAPSIECRFDNRVLPIVRRLAILLDEQEVVYCQWKGNHKVHRWASGDGDLDLLLDRASLGRFIAVLTRLGFKQVYSARGQQIPGVFSFYGFDLDAGKFLHVHAYSRLVIGNRYRIPIEKALLQSAIRRNLLYAPSPELELIIFALRGALAYRLRGSILRIITGRAANSSLGAELKQLESEVDEERLTAIRKEHFPFLSARLFNECRQSLDPGCPAWKRLLLRSRLRRRLRAYNRKRQSVDRWLTIGRQLIRFLQTRIFKTPARKRLVNGGAIIALVGADGAGKTTCVSNVYDWISSRFYAKRFHLGKPPRSPITLAVIFLQKAHGLLRFSKDKTARSRLAIYIQSLRHLSIAKDRHRLYVRACRFASTGGMVICDRYPLPNIHLMDSPRIRSSLNGLGKTRLMSRLIEAEESYYRRIMAPDLMIALRVDPAIAVSRKDNEDANHVRTRSQELWEASWEGVDARLVDASLPAEQVLSKIKGLIWSSL